MWSFGIVMWEILTLGKTPYEEFDGDEVMKNVCSGIYIFVAIAALTLCCQVVMGYRLKIPEDAPGVIRDTVTACWSTHRPTFESIAENFALALKLDDVDRLPSLDTADQPRSQGQYTVIKISKEESHGAGKQDDDEERAAERGYNVSSL